MAGKSGFYSDVIIYDERNRYYYLTPQKNKPLLDDEVRGMGLGLLDQVRRAVQHTYGEVATSHTQYAGFYSTADSFKVEEATGDNQNNFIVKGGVSLDRPAVLYAKGLYIFLTKDIEYKYQMYTDPNMDLHTETDKTKTITPIPDISTLAADRIDIVYVNLKFAEVSADEGTNPDVYRDSNLKNPIVGAETAHRLRAVFDIKVHENWSGAIDKNIFEHNDFLGGITSGDFDPTDNEYKIPIAAIYREAFDDTIVNEKIIDLLGLYNKRVLSLQEISHRMSHGGFTETGLADQGYTGFTPQYPSGIIDEGAFATGLNEGLGTEAFNSNAVTPRVLDNTGKFMMDGLMVGSETGLIAGETGPAGLQPGEVIVQDLSAESIYIGYSDTNITGMREYVDKLNIVGRGETGMNIVSIENHDGETGSITVSAAAVRSGQVQNFYSVDYQGRVGINTWIPGWEPADPIWVPERYNDGLNGETGINIAFDVNSSARVRKHLLVEKDAMFKRDVYGKSWKIPGTISRENPAMFGFTGIPQDLSDTGVTGAIAAAIFKRGVAVVGETGIDAYGYTGGQVAYEAYDSDGTRLFTIGDFGYNFDRDIRSLYGIGQIQAFLSDYTFLDLPTLGSVVAGDIVQYDIILADSSHVTGMVTLTLDGFDGIEEIRDDILNNSSFPPDSGDTGIAHYSRVVQYDDVEILVDEHNNPIGTTVTSYTGMVEGVSIVEDPAGYTGMDTDQHGRIVLRDLLYPIDIDIESIPSFTVSRGLTTDTVAFTSFTYFGSGSFGGDLQDVKFAKLDLGEGADGWLFNGDVYFNGNGLLNRVTFSPNVLFRDDVFIYGTVYANEQVFSFATVQNIDIRQRLTCNRTGYFREGVSVGEDANTVFETLRATDPDLNLYVKNKAMANELVLRGDDVNNYLTGTLRFTNLRSSNVYAYIGGIHGDADNPFGLHLVDDRNVADTAKFKEFTMDFSDGRGTYSDMSLVLQGDLSITRYFQTQYLGVGPLDEINTDYRLQVNGRALINDVLEVKALRFVGAEAPEGSDDIIDPSNITTITDGEEVYQNNEIILREKKFTSTERIYIDNQSSLGVLGYTNAQDYYEIGVEHFYDTEDDGAQGRFSFDNISYLETQFDEIVESGTDTTPDEIIIEDIILNKYKKVRCERIRIASLGSLIIEWSGYKFDTSPSVPTESAIQSYYFTSAYFRNRDGGINVDWYPEEERFADDNFLFNIRADIINANASIPTVYTIDKSIGIYIPRSDWWQYVKPTDTSGYKSYALYYPYENVIDEFNISTFSEQYTGSETSTWKVVLYPRLVKQTRVNVGTNQDKLYTGEWSMDICLLTTAVGKAANIIGKSYISYYQS